MVRVKYDHNPLANDNGELKSRRESQGRHVDLSQLRLLVVETDNGISGNCCFNYNSTLSTNYVSAAQWCNSYSQKVLLRLKSPSVSNSFTAANGKGITTAHTWFFIRTSAIVCNMNFFFDVNFAEPLYCIQWPCMWNIRARVYSISVKSRCVFKHP